MSRIALGLEYEGTDFYGWQRQTNQISLQACVEDAISKVVNQPVTVVCAGRTDARVHALGQVIHFDTPVPRPMEAWLRGINTHLPDSIRVKWATPVSQEFHARYSALARRYFYFVYVGSVSPGHFRRGVTWVHYPLNLNAMRMATQYWLGEQDFTSFRAKECQAKSPIRTIYDFSIHQSGDLYVFDITANAFLHHMIRNMMGTLLRIGRGVMPVTEADKVLKARDRSKAYCTAPPDGLYFGYVTYPDTFALDNRINIPWFVQSMDFRNKLNSIYRQQVTEAVE